MRAGGYFYSFDAAGVRQEADTLTCNHCNKVVIVKPKCDPTNELGGHCRLCDKFICDKCVDKNKCVPFIKKIEQEEEKYYRWQQQFRR